MNKNERQDQRRPDPRPVSARGGDDRSSSGRAPRGRSGRDRGRSRGVDRQPGRPPRASATEHPPAAPGAAASAASTTASVPDRPRPITHVDTLALSAWDLARTRRGRDTSRGQVMVLRTHQKLTAAFEEERNIPLDNRSYLRAKENAKGACLLIHGVSTGPGDLHSLAQFLFENDFNVYVLRLPDYGTPGHTISEVSWESSLLQARQCFQLLGRGNEKVHVVGLGFGAALALHLASRENVASLVLLAPAIMPRESFFQRLAVRMRLHRLRPVHRLLGWNAELMEGMDKARGRIGRIRAPIYAAQCDDDDRASPNSLRFLQRKARNRASRFQVFATGGHAILAAHGERTLFKEILRFWLVPG